MVRKKERILIWYTRNALWKHHHLRRLKANAIQFNNRQTFMIVDNCLIHDACLNTNYHALSSINVAVFSLYLFGREVQSLYFCCFNFSLPLNLSWIWQSLSRWFIKKNITNKDFMNLLWSWTVTWKERKVNKYSPRCYNYECNLFFNTLSKVLFYFSRDFKGI